MNIPFRIITWNMQGGSGRAGTENKLEFLLNCRDNSKFNIFCLQEIGAIDTTSFLNANGMLFTDLKKLSSQSQTSSSATPSSSSYPTGTYPYAPQQAAPSPTPYVPPQATPFSPPYPAGPYPYAPSQATPYPTGAYPYAPPQAAPYPTPYPTGPYPYAPPQAAPYTTPYTPASYPLNQMPMFGYNSSLQYLFLCTYKGNNYIAAIHEDFTATKDGKRCTTAILMDCVQNFQYYFDINEVTCGKRPGIMVTINNNFIVSSVHCLSGDCYSFNELGDLAKNIKSRVSKFIIAGDFNQEPEESKFAKKDTKSFKPPYYLREPADDPCIVCGDTATQGPGGARVRKLDYFVVSKNIYQEKLKPVQIPTNNYSGISSINYSDHDLLYLDININLDNVLNEDESKKMD